MPLTREGTNVREYKIPAIYEATTNQQVKDIPRPVDKAHVFIGTADDGRLYKFDATSSDADDSYNTLQPTDTNWSGRWKLMPYGTAAGSADIYNVQNFGATGDGTTDDSAAIQAATDAASITGGVVYFPFGDYRITSTINLDRGIHYLGVWADGLTINGAGALIINDTGGTAFQYSGALVTGDNLRIERLAFKEGTTGGTYGLLLSATSQVTVTHCAFDGMDNASILLNSVDGATIEHCFFVSPTAADYILVSTQARNTLIDNNVFIGSSTTAACIKSGNATLKGFQITNNQASALGGTFLDLMQSNKTVEALRVEGNHLVSSTGETIGANQEMIHLNGSAANLLVGLAIENNYIDYDAATYEWAINAAYLENSTISNNYIAEAGGTADIALDANSSNNYLVGNTLTGSFSDGGAGNQYIAERNSLIGNKTQTYVDDRQLSKDSANAIVGDGVDDYVSLGDNTLLEFGDGSSDIACGETAIIEIDDLTNAFIITSKATGSAPNNERTFQVLTSGKLEIKLFDADPSVYIGQTGDTVLEVGKRYFVAWTYDGSGTSAGIKLYVGAVSETLTLTEAGAYTAMHATTASLYCLRYSSTYGKGKIVSYVPWDRELSATDIALLAANGNQPETADQWGGATATSGLLTVGKRYRITTFVAGDDFTNVGAASNATGVEFVATGTTPTTWTNSSTITNIGAVASYQGRNLAPTDSDWVDESSNRINGTLSGTTAVHKSNRLDLDDTNASTGETVLNVGTGFRVKKGGAIEPNKIILKPGTELTIASGEITVTGSFHTVDTESDAASDDLVTINGGEEGMLLTLRATNSSRAPTLKDGTGNIALPSDRILGGDQDIIELIYTGGIWCERTYANNVV